MICANCKKEISDTTYLASGVYFVENDTLYYYDELEGIPSLNIIQYKRID